MPRTDSHSRGPPTRVRMAPWVFACGQRAGRLPERRCALAGMTEMHHLRKLLPRSRFKVVQPDHRKHAADIAKPNGSDGTDVVPLNRGEYTEVR
jgi:hypothetical protein